MDRPLRFWQLSDSLIAVSLGESGTTFCTLVRRPWSSWALLPRNDGLETVFGSLDEAKEGARVLGRLLYPDRRAVSRDIYEVPELSDSISR
jgi:hypothetical protein